MGQHTQQKLIRDILFLQQVQHNSLMTCLHFFSQGINLVSKFEFAQTFVSIKPDQCSNKSRVMKYLTSSTVTQLIIPHSILSSKKSQDAGCNWSSIFFLAGGIPQMSVWSRYALNLIRNSRHLGLQILCGTGEEMTHIYIQALQEF